MEEESSGYFYTQKEIIDHQTKLKGKYEKQ